MRTNRFGNTGLIVSELCLGTMTFGESQGRFGPIAGLDLAASTALVRQAIDAGINFIDTANVYSEGRSEEILGQALRDLGVKRPDVVVATKAMGTMGPGANEAGASRFHLLHEIDASLARLGMDHVDLYQIHGWDALTPIEETLRALEDLIRQGKVRYIGCSNFPAWRVAEAQFVARGINTHAFVSCQDEYSLIVRDNEKDLFPAAQAYNLGILPFFPLASGLLTGKYKRGEAAPADTRFAKAPALLNRYMSDKNLDIVQKLQDFASAHGRTMLELAFSWLAARPQVSSVIAGATRPEQIEQNVKAIGWKLTADEMAQIDALTKG